MGLFDFLKKDKRSKTIQQTEIKYIPKEEKSSSQNPVIALIHIDNYEDLMQNNEEFGKQHLLAEIDKCVVAWTSVTQGILRKTERDKYIFIFERCFFETLHTTKYSILESVKEINIGNKIPVTLSIGICMNSETMAKDLQNASACLDIALGRGGDQVVIRDGDSISYYGGLTREFQKRTRVKARMVAGAFRELIKQSSNVLVMGHGFGDMDSVGASLGVYRIAATFEKKANIIIGNSSIDVKKMLEKIKTDPEYKNVLISPEEAFSFVGEETLLVIVDTYKPGYTEAPLLLEKVLKVAVIDHHRKNADFIQNTILSYHETFASSTCELVTEIIQYLSEEVVMTKLEAEALFAGIIMDTKNFMFKTGARTFDAAAYLKKFGVDSITIKRLFQKDLKTYNNISAVVKNAKIIFEEIAISVCPKDVENAQLITAKAADELLGVIDVMAAFVLCNINGIINISGRSLGDINVQVILEKFGGGGHMGAAGALLSNTTEELAIEMLSVEIEHYMKEYREMRKSAKD